VQRFAELRLPPIRSQRVWQPRRETLEVPLPEIDSKKKQNGPPQRPEAKPLPSNRQEQPMFFASVRLVTNDLDRLVAFYAQLTGAAVNRPSPEFAEIRMDGAVLAISSERLVNQFNAGAARAAANSSAIIEFLVEDVDGVRARLGEDADVAMPPSDMPWGNRSMLLRDPDGNVINIFARPRPAA
jgi:uncharacterized glyoxalase superfamily protein PhnB